MYTGALSNKCALERHFNSGTKGGAGFTKLVELIPNKKDSISGALLDNVFHGICPGLKPLPGNFVS